MPQPGGVEIICFASLYALALVLEATRWFWRAPIVRPVALGAVMIGLGVQTWFLVAWTERTGLAPVATLYDSLLVLSWMLVIVYAYLSLHYPAGPGLLFLPTILGLLVVAQYLERRGAAQPANLDHLMQFWGMVHGLFLLLGAAAAAVGFAMGGMYLVQSHRLKAKVRPAPGLRLPSLEWLERMNQWAITLAFPLLTCGLVIGLVLAVADPVRPTAGPRVWWRDSKVICTALLWLVFALLLHVPRYRPDLRGRKVAVFTIVAFGLLIFTFVGVNLLTTTWHSAVGGGAL